MNIRIIGMSIIAMAWTSIALADLIPPGNKAVDHQLVFQDSELFQRYRFVAAPIAGFQGVAVIQPGVSFRFSSKYGTKIFVVPDGQPDPVQYDREAFEAWPHAFPPVQEVASVPITSQTNSLLTALKLKSFDGAELIIEVADVTADKTPGSAIPGPNLYSADDSSRLYLALNVGIGIIVCSIAFVALRTAQSKRNRANRL